MSETLARNGATKSHLLVFLAAFGLVLIAAVWAVVSYRVTAERSAAVRQAFADVNALAQSFEERTARALRQIDQASQFVSFEFREHQGRVALSRFIQQKGMLPTELVMLITLVDANGAVTASTQEFAPTSLADREHFRVHKERDTGELYVSKPVLGRVSKRWSVQMTRRLSNMDGSFAGVVVISVDPGFFVNFYTADELGTKGVIGVLGTDGVFRVRRMGNDVSFGTPVDFTGVMQRFENARAGKTIVTSPIDGIKRYVAFRQLKDYPLGVLVGLADEERLASYYEREILYLASAGMATVLIMLAISLLMLQGVRVLAAERAARAAHLHLQQKTADLEASQNRLQMIADNVPALIAYVDADQRYRFANAFFQEVFGVEPREVIGKTMAEVLGDQVLPIREKLAQALGGQRVTFEHQIKRDGRRRYMQATYLPDFGDQGRVQAVYILAHDITARKLAEDALRASEERFRAIADNLPALICYIDRERRYRFNNRAHEAYFGRPVEQMTGRHVEEVIGSDTYKARAPLLDQAFAGQRVEFDQEDVRDGKTRILRTIYVPHRDRNGEVIGMYVLAHDITALKVVEAKLTLLSQYDTLTGLSNRHRFDEKMVEAIARSQRNGTPVGLMFLDIDQFKSINDTLGHQAGDEALREFARRLLASVRATDTVARLAGDEFVVILEGLRSPEETYVVAKKILTAMEPPLELGGRRWKMATSIGIAVRDGAEADASSLLREADQALYAAKAAGGNCWHLAESSLSEATTRA